MGDKFKFSTSYIGINQISSLNEFLRCLNKNQSIDRAVFIKKCCYRSILFKKKLDN